MDAKIQDWWITALVSGDYDQGKGLLRKGNQFCCLGVLCDLYILKNPGKAHWKQGVEDSFHVTNMDDEFGWRSFLPMAVRQWAGIVDAAPLQTLMNANDTGTSFSIIATTMVNKL
jgi:hypothetical protein